MRKWYKKNKATKGAIYGSLNVVLKVSNYNPRIMTSHRNIFSKRVSYAVLPDYSGCHMEDELK